MLVVILCDFIKVEIDSMELGVLFLVYFKVIMMKVLDLIIFGYFVLVYFEDFIVKYGVMLDVLGWNLNGGIGDLDKLIVDNDELKVDLKIVLDVCLLLYMVDSDKGIINLYVLLDVIIDVLMFVVIKVGGIGWGLDGKVVDIKCCIFDNSYVIVYDEIVNYFKEIGKLDVIFCGVVLNCGLMVQKVEEYGSYLIIFEMLGVGIVCIVLDNGDVLIEYSVEIGDIWCLVIVKVVFIVDWIKLGICCYKVIGILVFWLDVDCVYDVELIKYVEFVLKEVGLDILIFVLCEVICFMLENMCEGCDVVIIIGNVLCDYLIDLFLILELGILVKMLLIVLLMQGGGLFEIGVGGLVLKYV